MIILLDSSPLGLITNPKFSPQADECNKWLDSLIADNVTVLVPEIVDYEIRRELLRAGKEQGIARLDAAVTSLGYLPSTTAAMRLAAGLWAAARKLGKQTADDASLDVDMILCGQALELAQAGLDPVIATANVRHLSSFVKALRWQDLSVL